MCQFFGQGVYQSFGKINQFLGNIVLVYQLFGEDKKWDSQQGKVVEFCGYMLSYSCESWYSWYVDQYGEQVGNINILGNGNFNVQ